MIGYLLTGNPEVVFKNLCKRLRTKLESHPHFMAKPHRVSNHRRKHRRRKNCPTEFRCHHLVMPMY
jgi:septum formation inhibitor MinC